MLSLIRKDLILNKKNLLIYMAMFTAYIIWFSSQASPRIYLVFVCVLVSMMSVTLQAREDKFKGAALTFSLPFNRKTIVFSRYLTSWLLMLAAWLYTLILTCIIPISKIGPGDLLTLEAVFFALVLMTLIFSFLLPFTIRFGIVGLMGFLVFLQVLGIVALVMAMRTQKADLIRTTITWVSDGVAYLSGLLGTAGFYLFLLFLAVGLSFGSLKLSQFLMSRKEI